MFICRHINNLHSIKNSLTNEFNLYCFIAFSFRIHISQLINVSVFTSDSVWKLPEASSKNLHFRCVVYLNI